MRLARPNFTSVLDVFGVTGVATAQGQYTDRPTVIYTPLTGGDFLQKLMTPIPSSAVLFVLQAGYPADVIMPIALDSINGIHNESRRVMRHAADRQRRARPAHDPLRERIYLGGRATCWLPAAGACAAGCGAPLVAAAAELGALQQRSQAPARPIYQFFSSASFCSTNFR